MCKTETLCASQGGTVAGMPGENGMVAGAAADTETETNTAADNESNAGSESTDSGDPFPTEDFNSGGGSGGTLTNPLQVSTLEGLLALILDAVVRLGTIVLVLMLVYVGYLFVAAQGKPEKIKEARSALMWTAVGGLVLLGAQGLALVIKSTVESL